MGTRRQDDAGALDGRPSGMARPHRATVKLPIVLVSLAVLGALSALVVAAVGPELHHALPWVPAGEGATPASEPPVPEHLAPRHVLATQGPTDPAHLRVLVTWDRSDATAVAYDVLRDGETIASVRVSEDPWEDMAYEDHDVAPSTSYGYQVRAHYPDGVASRLSVPAEVVVRSDADIGSGETFEVDTFQGSDSERAEAAVDAARRAGGGVVVFGPRTYRLDRPLEVAHANDIVLRGSGSGVTALMPGFPGSDHACAPYTEVVTFRGTLRPLDAVSATADIPQGARTVQVTAAEELAAGDVIVLDAMHPQLPPDRLARRGAVQDPATGRDDRYPWDANEVVDVDGDVVTFRHPVAYPFPADLTWQRLEDGRGNGLEQLTVQGRDAQEDTYYRLIGLDHVAGFTMADVRGRYANSQYVRASGYDIRVNGFEGPDGGPNSYDTGNCKYKLSVYRAANFTFVAGTMGTPAHDRNQDFLVFQWAQRAVVRHSQFWGSRSMAINEHGGGSREHLYENNHFATGPRSAAAVWLGNTTWGFGGPVIVRNNTFRSNTRDLYLLENTYGVQFLDNRSWGNLQEGVYFAGWAGPDTSPDGYGSSRLVIARNEWRDAQGDGLVLGADTSAFYPFAGVRDVVVADNHLGFASRAIQLFGDAATSRHYQVVGNRGSADYRGPAFGDGVYWQDNADERAHGRPAPVDWDVPYFGWEPGAPR